MIGTLAPPVHVVVVEDSLPDVMLVEESLKARSVRYTMTHFKDGVEALNALTNEALSVSMPDVIVVDLNMPRMGGLELLANLKKNQVFDKIPIAILTSSLQPQEKEQARRLGASRFVRKPVDLREFLEKVGNMLHDLTDSENHRKKEWAD